MRDIMEALKNFFIIDQKTQNISHTKFYSNMGYITVIVMFIFSVIKQITIEPNLLLMFGAIVIGNRTAAKLINVFKSKI